MLLLRRRASRPLRGPVRGLLLLLASWLLVAGGVGADRPVAGVERMLEAVRETYRHLAPELGIERPDPRVLEAMRRVPRHEFVPEDLRDAAYEDRPLPIGHGQTISQPSIVAVMTDLLRVQPGDRILEVGTGSGYQAAILAEMGAEVYSIEIIEPLARTARERLRRLGYDRVRVKLGDGYHGWPEHAPYDGIIVTAAASHVPPPLVRQLKPGARMVIPVGGRFTTQYLMLVEKQPDGTIVTRQLLPVRFVPLTGQR
jgi:protein-L-isoaspartate(D-aspartate) O-methyltransferase